MNWHCRRRRPCAAIHLALVLRSRPARRTRPPSSSSVPAPNNARMQRREARWLAWHAVQYVRSGAGVIQRARRQRHCPCPCPPRSCRQAAAAVRGATCAAPGAWSRPSPSPRINNATVDDPAMPGTPSCAAHMLPTPACSEVASLEVSCYIPSQRERTIYDDELVTPARLVTGAFFVASKFSFPSLQMPRPKLVLATTILARLALFLLVAPNYSKSLVSRSMP